MPDIYMRIHDLCRENSITVTELCKLCNIPRASLSDYKMGRIKSLSAKTLSKIAEYFSVSVEYLMTGDSKQSVENNLKVALFGGETVVTEEMWDEVKRYARYIRERNNEI